MSSYPLSLALELVPKIAGTVQKTKQKEKKGQVVNMQLCMQHYATSSNIVLSDDVSEFILYVICFVVSYAKCFPSDSLSPPVHSLSF